MATGHNPIGSRAYTSTPTPDLGHQAARAFSNPPPAIVQPAKRDWKYYEGAITASEAMTGKLLKEYKEGGTWKEQYKTWTDACVPLNISRRQADRLISEDISIRTECPNESTKQDEKALKKLEQSRPSPREEEPEKPRVKTADEVISENGHVGPVKPQAKPKENGKPKIQLSLWKEIEESLVGRAINRADELNRHCGNPVLHAEFILTMKTALKVLEAWKASIK